VAKARKKRTKRSKSPASFEDALDLVEQIVHELEDGKIGLSDALDRYQQAVQLLKDCYRLLEKAEHRIQTLSGVDADGNPITEPFQNDEDESLEEKSDARARRRSAPRVGRRKTRTPRTEVDGGQSLF
jgi:exodeoxyribonuclease VII small subunit